ncbi:MAG TPA: putative toxin-antitoxin system toxin component, PIN family [bacterium]|nr:putative toxin-antitoxin system toxin component, PIN family [bacterium]
MKVVLDTNVVVSALLHRGPTHRLYGLWKEGKIAPCVSQAMLEEYVRVLHYPKFGLSDLEVAGILKDHLLPWIEKTEEHKGRLAHPPSDRFDEPFLRAALAAHAKCLVSGDPHLTALNGRYPFPILSPSDLLNRYFRG